MSTGTIPSGRRSRRSVDSAASQPRGAYLAALLLLSLFAWAPLLYPGYLQVHSGFLPLFHLAGLAAAPDRLAWLPTAGVTPDLLRGEGPLAYWLALALRPLAGDVGAIKAVFALNILALGLGVYACLAWTRRDPPAEDPAGLAELLARRAGLLAAAVAMLWPPLLATVYVRGALAEAVLMALVAWGVWAVASVRGEVPGVRGEVSSVKGEVSGVEGEVSGVRGEVSGVKGEVSGVRGQVSGVRGQVSRFMYVGGAGAVTAALFWTQAGLALWATALLLAWALWPGAAARARGTAAAAVAGGALLGGGLFWLLHRGQAPAGQPWDVAAHAVYPYQLLAPAWGFGVSGAGWQDGLPLQLGFAALGLAALTVVLAFGQRPPLTAHRSPLTVHRSPLTVHRSPFPAPLLTFAAVATLALILLSTTLARPLWGVDLLAATLTYPWQLYALVGAPLALLAGGLLAVERRLAVLPTLAAAVALVVLSSYPYLAPRTTQVTPDPATAAIFGAGQVMLVEASAGAASPAPSPSEGEGWGEGEFLTLAWQALQPVDFDYNVFIHAVDAAGNRVAQWDGQPLAAGEPYPMTAWQVGEVVRSSYRLALDPAAAPVQRIYVGLYNWQTGERLPVNGGDQVTLEVGP